LSKALLALDLKIMESLFITLMRVGRPLLKVVRG
jgi:hypothetical protein